MPSLFGAVKLSVGVKGRVPPFFGNASSDITHIYAEDIALGPIKYPCQFYQFRKQISQIISEDPVRIPRPRIQDPERSLAILAMFQCFDQHNKLYIGKEST